MFAGTPEHTQAEIAARHSAAGSEGEVFKATYADWEAVPVASVGTNTTTVEATLRKPYTVADMVFSDDGSHLAVYYTSDACLLYTSPSPRDRTRSRMPSSA